MLPAGFAIGPSARGGATRTRLDRLIDLLLPRSHEPQGSVSSGERVDPCHGFDWNAPVFVLPRSLKVKPPMHDPARPHRPSTACETADPFRWRRHPALRQARTEPGIPERERLARLAAVRGVLAARDGDLEAASRHFCNAACEPSIRFQVVPGFWGCSRGGMDAAVAAYERAGRLRDASALAATIRIRFRPRAIPQPRSATSPAALSNIDPGKGADTGTGT